MSKQALVMRATCKDCARAFEAFMPHDCEHDMVPTLSIWVDDSSSVHTMLNGLAPKEQMEMYSIMLCDAMVTVANSYADNGADFDATMRRLFRTFRSEWKSQSKHNIQRLRKINPDVPEES